MLKQTGGRIFHSPKRLSTYTRRVDRLKTGAEKQLRPMQHVHMHQTKRYIPGTDLRLHLPPSTGLRPAVDINRIFTTVMMMMIGRTISQPGRVTAIVAGTCHRHFTERNPEINERTTREQSQIYLDTLKRGGFRGPANPNSCVVRSVATERQVACIELPRGVEERGSEMKVQKVQMCCQLRQ